MCPVKRDLAISNLKKYTLRGTNHHQFLFAIQTFTCVYFYIPTLENQSPIREQQ